MSDAIAIRKARKAQIRPGVEAALQLIVQRGLPFSEAAEAVGYRPESLAKALRKPHVLDRLADIKREWMSARTFKSWAAVAELADGAQSEDVRLKANRLVLEAAGELSGDRGRDAPKAQQLVQIILSHDGARGVSVSGGVIESPPFAPQAE
jgi:hypothetical protein